MQVMKALYLVKTCSLRIELPEGMEPTDTSAIITGDFAYFGNEGQYPESGSVITEAELKQENGKWIMTATVGDMFAGTQIEMSFPVKLPQMESQRVHIRYGMHKPKSMTIILPHRRHTVFGSRMKCRSPEMNSLLSMQRISN